MEKSNRTGEEERLKPSSLLIARLLQSQQFGLNSLFDCRVRLLEQSKLVEATNCQTIGFDNFFSLLAVIHRDAANTSRQPINLLSFVAHYSGNRSPSHSFNFVISFHPSGFYCQHSTSVASNFLAANFLSLGCRSENEVWGLSIQTGRPSAS